MATFTKRGDGYSVRWHGLDGANRRRQVPDRATAKALIQDVERAHARGREWTPDVGRASPPLVTQVADEETALDVYFRDRRRVWKASTMRQEQVSLAVFVAWVASRERRRRVPLDVLSKRLMADYWDHMVTDRGCSVMTANQRVRQAEAFWSWAYDDETWGEEVPRPRSLDLPSAVRGKVRAPSWSQMDAAVLYAMDSETPHYGRLFFFLRCTGLRASQAMRVEWADIDLERATLTVRPELGKTTQEQRGRMVPLAPVLVDELKRWGRREGFVIDWPAPGERFPDAPPRTPNRRTLKKMWSRSGVKDPDVYRQPQHAFRHGFVTELARADVAEEVRKALVGHSRGVHGDVYTDDRGIMEMMRAAVAKVPALRQVADLDAERARRGRGKA